MRTHELKTWPHPFKAVRLKYKRHEVRRNDRNFEHGDFVRLLEWDPSAGDYTGHQITATIGHVTPGGEWGLPHGLCVFSLLNVEVVR